ncbi:thioredoxin [Siculibacillus lacustris]|uniref:Thioredoxin n=2 Tax=Siculibacillus lacustris TaxID=1549641 RepID=A0A4Q9VN18_9HYPH|nr:thioredoxin [Siculibacillus lacustris]
MKATVATSATPAAAPAGDDLIRETSTRDFMKDVIDASVDTPVLVDFWAEWCGPCKQLTPILEKVVRAGKGRVKLVKMNIDNHPEVAGQLGIRSIPAVIAFKGGQPVDGFMGAVPESQIQTFIDKIAGPGGPSEIDVLVAEGDAAAEAGDLAEASKLYAAALRLEPAHFGATVGLAGVYVTAGEFAQAEQFLTTLPATAAGDPRVAAVRARIALANLSSAVDDVLALEARLDKDPADHQARFDLALALAGKDHRQAAVDHLIEIIRRDRAWQEDGARKQLLQFFEAWGPKDPATLSGRRRLSSVLFA